MIKFKRTKLDGAVIIEPQVFKDERGFFYESYHLEKYKEIGIKSFVQDNFSKSSRDVLRGLHFQRSKPQGKLVSVLEGEVYDVAVDLRRDSSTFGQWEGVLLSSENNRQFYVPENFAHGFLVLSETATFHYKCTNFYDPNDEDGIMWNDQDLNIDWPTDTPIISAKDKTQPSFEAFKNSGNN